MLRRSLMPHIRAGVCRHCLETELTATMIVGISVYVDASKYFALIGNLLDTVDRGHKAWLTQSRFKRRPSATRQSRGGRGMIGSSVVYCRRCCRA